MRQVDKDFYDSDGNDVTNFHNTSVPLDSRVTQINPTMFGRYASSSGGSTCSDDRSTPSSDFIEETRERKLSTCSETSSTTSACHSSDGNVDFDVGPVRMNKYDDIIDKIVGLRFTQKVNLNVNVRDTRISTGNANEKIDRSTTMINLSNDNEEKFNVDRTRIVENHKIDDVNGNYEVSKNAKTIYDDDKRGERGNVDLAERGPVRPHFNGQIHHEKPYYTLDLLEGTSQNHYQNQSYTCDYDITAEQILRNKQFSEKLNPCLDKLSDYVYSDRIYFSGSDQLGNTDFNGMSGWSSPEINYAETGTPNSNGSADYISNAKIPSIVLSEPREVSLLEILTSTGFQGAQSPSAAGSLQNPSAAFPSTEHWPVSPASSYNVLSSNSHSPGSSPARSSCSSGNMGSPLLHASSPSDSHLNLRTFRVRQALSSPESSSHSFSDTPSPKNYHSGVDKNIEDELGVGFDHFSTWHRSCVSSHTIIDSDGTIDGIDNNELQLVDEVIRSDQNEKRNDSPPEEAQVVPNFYSFNEENCENDVTSNFSKDNERYEQRLSIDNVFDNVVKKSVKHEESMIEPRSNAIGSGVRNDLLLIDDEPLDNKDGLLNSEQNNHLVCPDLNDVYDLTYADDPQSSSLYNVDLLNAPASCSMDFDNTMENLIPCVSTSSDENDRSSTIETSTSIDDSINAEAARTDDRFDDEAKKINGETSNFTFDEFQIPETVSSYRQNRIRRISERSIAPWPTLNLPSTESSERLKAELDPVEVEKAMKNLLTKPNEEWAFGDEDGDTPLMCLVGNPSELEKKKAYLVPLVERLRNIKGALTITNNRGEDALYLAAINSPKLSCVTGYLAATMIGKGIDVSQRFYHTRGDTLIHAIAAKGDTHVAVLAELLSLRTPQGNSVFDLSKRNYDGRTALHVAVESHEPVNSGVSCIGTTRLLLENGADVKIKETKCGDTALHIAVSSCSDPALVKVLLHKSHRDVANIHNYNNNTPVHMAAALSDAVPIEKQMEICADLMRAGGQTNIQNRQGKTPLALVSADRKDSIKRIFHKKTCNFVSRN